jgi:hypothetical protein
LITQNGQVDESDFIEKSRIIIVNFDQMVYNCPRAPYSYIMIHSIDMSNLEIVTYRKKILSINSVIDNHVHCNDMKISRCCGYKCRKFGPEELCLSCSDPDYINYYELLQLTQHAKLVNDMLIIYTEQDFENIFHNVLNLFTQTYPSSEIYSREPELIAITEKKRFALIHTIYLSFVKPYNPLTNYLHQLKIGPHPTNIPIPTTLLTKNYK